MAQFESSIQIHCLYMITKYPEISSGSSGTMYPEILGELLFNQPLPLVLLLNRRVHPEGLGIVMDKNCYIWFDMQVGLDGAEFNKI